jgi:hypothetical protein
MNRLYSGDESDSLAGVVIVRTRNFMRNGQSHCLDLNLDRAGLPPPELSLMLPGRCHLIADRRASCSFIHKIGVFFLPYFGQPGRSKDH